VGYGRYLEEFTVGQIIKHWPGRTITETDNTWFALLTNNQHPLHSDAHYAAQTQHGQRVVLGPLVFSIGIGLTVADVSGRAIANLEIEKIVHHAPTFNGDTLYSESTVLDVHESRHLPHLGRLVATRRPRCGKCRCWFPSHARGR